MRVHLMLTCLCDAFFGEVGIAAVRLLEHAGCEVSFDERQSCCGQPPFNSGDWTSARAMADHVLQVFSDDSPVVVPSSSCAAMLRDGYGLLGRKPPVAYELGEFLATVAGVSSWPTLPEPRRVVLHQSCHGRALGVHGIHSSLLALVGNLDVVSPDRPEQCCGFGGAFSITHPHTSQSIGAEKIHQLVETGCDTVVSADMGCLVHLRGMAERAGIRLTFQHWAELMAEAL